MHDCKVLAAIHQGSNEILKLRIRYPCNQVIMPFLNTNIVALYIPN